MVRRLRENPEPAVTGLDNQIVDRLSARATLALHRPDQARAPTPVAGVV